MPHPRGRSSQSTPHGGVAPSRLRPGAFRKRRQRRQRPSRRQPWPRLLPHRPMSHLPPQPRRKQPQPAQSPPPLQPPPRLQRALQQRRQRPPRPRLPPLLLRSRPSPPRRRPIRWHRLIPPTALVEADIKLTQTVITYARHVQAGRFAFTRVSPNNIELPQAPPDTADVLTKVSTASNAAKALDEFSPQHPAYQKLKAVLAEMRGKAGGGTKEILDGQPLKPATGKAQPMEDERVPLLREKLGLTVTGDASDKQYDAKLVEAVKKYQKGLDLPATGIVDSKTIKEL